MRLVMTITIDNFPEDDTEGLVPACMSIDPAWSTTEERYALEPFRDCVLNINGEDQPAEDVYYANYWGEWPDDSGENDA